MADKQPGSAKNDVVIRGYHPEMADLVQTKYDYNDQYLGTMTEKKITLNDNPESVPTKLKDPRPK